MAYCKVTKGLKSNTIVYLKLSWAYMSKNKGYAHHPKKVHVWVAKSDVDLSVLKEQLIPLLSNSEICRLNATKNLKKKLEFLLGRSLLRYCLDAISSEKQAWKINERPHHKPIVHPSLPNWHFSLSHSHDLICIAFSPARIGVDIEKINPKRNHRETAAEFMSPQELNTFLEFKTPNLPYFYKIWTLKESLYKTITTEQQQRFVFREIDIHQHTTKQRLTSTSIQLGEYCLSTTTQSEEIELILHNTTIEEDALISESSATHFCPIGKQSSQSPITLEL